LPRCPNPHCHPPPPPPQFRPVKAPNFFHQLERWSIIALIVGSSATLNAISAVDEDDDEKLEMCGKIYYLTNMVYERERPASAMKACDPRQ
jgi:hypothetical protein